MLGSASPGDHLSEVTPQIYHPDRIRKTQLKYCIIFKVPTNSHFVWIYVQNDKNNQLAKKIVRFMRFEHHFEADFLRTILLY